MDFKAFVESKEPTRKPPQIPEWFRSGLGLASKLLVAVPSVTDGPIALTVKGISAIHVLHEHFDPRGKRTAIQALIDKHDLVAKNSQHFVDLFFGTPIQSSVDLVTTFDKEANYDIIEARSPLGRLYFMRYVHGLDRQPEATFYHSRDFNFQAMTSMVWAHCEDRIQISTTGDIWTKRYTFRKLSPVRNPLYGSAASLMDRTIKRHEASKANGVTRTYMFYGPPGTGKTSFAMEFATRLGGRLMRLDAQEMVGSTPDKICFLIEALEPRVLIVDDVDKAAAGNVPAMLATMQQLKLDHADLTTIMTANGTSGFDKGLFRPGRIDTWIQFDLPSPEERTAILSSYAPSSEHLERLVVATEGLSHDYLRGIADNLHVDDVDTISADTARIKKLLETAK